MDAPSKIPPESAPLACADARRLTLPRSHRITRERDFQRAYRQGARARGSVLVVVAVANELPHARIGLSVGKVIWKRAVRRNRVRRIFREAFRLSQHELPPGFDLVLIPAAPRLEPTLEATRAELVLLARKAAAKWSARPRRPEGPAGVESRPRSNPRRPARPRGSDAGRPSARPSPP